MKTNWLRPLGAALFLIMLSLRPGDALAAACEALIAWALSVAPALLPFLIAAPAFTCPEVCALLSRISRPLIRLFGLPVNSTGALLIGLLSGSPAGAAALSSVPADASDSPGAYLRAALMASGASPAFLMTGVAVAMLDSPGTGWLLLRSQLLAILSGGLLLRRFGTGGAAIPPAAVRQLSSVSRAMQTLLTIGGYMTFFSVLARLISCFTHPSLETPLLALFELSGGCRALASLPRSQSLILPLISAAACFGGVSVFMQCMSFLAPLGVRYSEYAAGKLLQSALSALYTFLQMDDSFSFIAPQTVPVFCLLSLLLAVMLFPPHSNGRTEKSA